MAKRKGPTLEERSDRLGIICDRLERTMDSIDLSEADDKTIFEMYGLISRHQLAMLEHHRKMKLLKNKTDPVIASLVRRLSALKAADLKALEKALATQERGRLQVLSG